MTFIEIPLFRFPFVVSGLGNAMLSADIGNSLIGDFSLFEDFDDLTLAEFRSFHGETPITILSCNSTLLLGIILGATYLTDPAVVND